VALTGIERSESRSKISAELLVGVISALKSRSDHVVIDLGEVISGSRRRRSMPSSEARTA
jgi:hypothetical protein